MGIDPDTGSQMEERARRAKACKVRARRLEMVLGEWTEDVLKACQLSGISGGANCRVREMEMKQVGGREDLIRRTQERMRKALKNLRFLSQDILTRKPTFSRSSHLTQVSKAASSYRYFIVLFNPTKTP